MAVNYSVAARTAKMTTLRDLCQNGTLQMLTAANAVVSTHTLSATAGTVTSGVWTLAFVSATVAATASGTVTQARIRNNSNADVITGLTVGTTGSDINVQNAAINSGQDVTISAATITET